MEIKLSPKQMQIVVVAAGILLGGGYVYWNFLLKPQIDLISANKRKLAELKEQILTAEREARRLPALKDERERLTNELARLEKQLPKDKDVPNIIRILTREALQESLEFNQLSPKSTLQKQYFEVVPFDMQMSGTLNSLARFLTALGQQERIFKFQGVKLMPKSAEEEGRTLLNIGFAIETYAYTGGY